MINQNGLDTRLDAWENEGGMSASSGRESERLDWAGYLARFHPHARRHDYVPLAAYIEYRRTLTSPLPVSRIGPTAERSRP